MNQSALQPETLQGD